MNPLTKPTTKPTPHLSECSLGACALTGFRRSPELKEDEPLDALVDRFPDPFPNRFPDHPGTIASVESECGGHDPKTLHDATFLNAVLPFAIGQALRHREPISLLCVAIDRLHGIQDLLGRAVADRVVRCVGGTVVSLIRASDVVARLDDDRVVAVLPRACDAGALRIGQLICEKVAASRWSLADQPGMKITVSVGAATFPSSADNVFALFAAADDALARAQSHGRNQAVLAARIPLGSPDETVVAPGGV